MPRFELHVVSPSAREGDAPAILAARYPEIALVEVKPLTGGVESWIVDAPSLTHIDRWVAERHVPVARRIERNR